MGSCVMRKQLRKICILVIVIAFLMGGCVYNMAEISTESDLKILITDNALDAFTFIEFIEADVFRITVFSICDDIYFTSIGDFDCVSSLENVILKCPRLERFFSNNDRFLSLTGKIYNQIEITLSSQQLYTFLHLVSNVSRNAPDEKFDEQRLIAGLPGAWHYVWSVIDDKIYRSRTTQHFEDEVNEDLLLLVYELLELSPVPFGIRFPLTTLNLGLPSDNQ